MVESNLLNNQLLKKKIVFFGRIKSPFGFRNSTIKLSLIVMLFKMITINNPQKVNIVNKMAEVDNESVTLLPSLHEERLWNSQILCSIFEKRS